MSDEAMQELRTLSREYAYLVWRLAKIGVPQEGERATLAQAMLEHTEYHDLWDQLSELGDDEIEIDGVNPLMHVTIHSTIENQLADGDPPSVVHALRRLMRQGLSRHEAIHHIGAVLADEIWQILTYDRPFDEIAYNRAMRRLGREPPPSAKRRGRHGGRRKGRRKKRR